MSPYERNVLPAPWAVRAPSDGRLLLLSPLKLCHVKPSGNAMEASD